MIDTPEDCFFQMSSYARTSGAWVCVITEKKGLIPWRVSRGLNWEDKTDKLKIVGEQKSVIRKSLEFSKQISRKRDEPKTPGSSGKISPEPDNSFKTKPMANRVNTKNSSKYCSEFE